jgi:cellulose synthase/poly-beta-1,6-N-acetylglucosamine synthase-like glycosyltransferase
VSSILRSFLIDEQWVVLAYFLGVNLFLLGVLVASGLEMRRHLLDSWHESRWRLLGSAVTPRISLLAPAFNEALTVSESLRSLLTLQYPNLEVVVINDGSSDETIAVLRRDFDLVPVHPIFQRRVESQPIHRIFRSRTSPGLVVVDKENGGKADALNAGINVASGELVCAIDADTIIESDALLRMVRPFLYRDDVVAAGGTIRVVNGSRVRGGRVLEPHAPGTALPALQAVEYLRAFLTGRLGWNRLGGNLIISGAFGLFRRDAMLAAGGYEHDTVGEDMELVARLRRRAYEEGGPGRIQFIPDPVAWTEVPSSLRVLGRQRDRWHRGLADVLWRHRGVFGRPKYGCLGLVAYPYFLFVELLAPVVEAFGLLTLVVGLALGAVSWSFACLFFALAYGLGIVVSTLTLALEQWSYRAYGGLRDRLRLAAWSVVEGFGYRQLTTLWRLRGLVKYVRGRSDWGVMTRTGFAPEDDGDAPAGQEPAAPTPARELHRPA